MHRVVHHAHVCAILHVLVISEGLLKDPIHNAEVIDLTPRCVPHAPVLMVHQSHIEVFTRMNDRHVALPAPQMIRIRICDEEITKVLTQQAGSVPYPERCVYKLMIQRYGTCTCSIEQWRCT